MKIVLTIPEGSIVRNLLEMKFIERLYDSFKGEELHLVIVSPAARIVQFTEKWKLNDNVTFEQILPYRPSSKQKRLALIRRNLVRRGFERIALRIRNCERKLISNEEYYNRLLHGCDVLLCTHIHLPFEQPLANLAYRMNIPVFGIVNSWDNVYKGIETHVDTAFVWNEVQEQEMIEMEGYSKSELTISGIPAFIPYFDNSCTVSREDFCKSIGFDPSRPIVTYASIGQFVPFFEETFILDEILNFRNEIEPSKRPQIICRLHPWSKKELFSRFTEEKDIYFNGFSNYTPTLNWTPTFEEVAFAGNLLRHSDICISPGSTMSIEAPIFDTPVIVPVYNEYQPEIWKDYYSRFCLAMHFGKLVRSGFAKIVTNRDEFRHEFFTYLNDPSADAEVRRRLVKKYIGDIEDPIGRIIDGILKVNRKV